MKGRHDTQLVYVHEGGEIDVGVVACVPRKGELVELHLEGAPHTFRVEQVTWAVATWAVTDPAFTHTPSTVVRVALSSCP